MPASSSTHSHSLSSHSGSTGKSYKEKRLKRLRKWHDKTQMKICRTLVKKLNLWKSSLYLLCFFEVAHSSLCLAIVEIEGIIIVEVALHSERNSKGRILNCVQQSISINFWIFSDLDRVEVDEHVLKLPEQEKTRRHALPARNCVWRGTGHVIVLVWMRKVTGPPPEC